MSELPHGTRDEAWELFCEWTESDSLRKHMLGVEAAMRAYAREFGEDEELWAAPGILHDLDYERYPDLDTGHPRMALEELERARLPRGADRRGRRPRRPSSAFRARPRWPRRCSRSTSCPGSSPRAR